MLETCTLPVRRRLLGGFVLLLAAAMLLGLPSVTLAQSEEDEEPYPQPAYRFYGFAGSVTIDDEPAPHGTVIEAWSNGEIVGKGLVRHGAWSIDVDYLHARITFTVNGLPDTHGSHDALVRGGQAMITLAAVTTDTLESDTEQETDCPQAGAMESDAMETEGCPEGDDEVMENEHEADAELTFPNSGGADFAQGSSSVVLVIGIALGLAMCGLGASLVARRNMLSRPRV